MNIIFTGTSSFTGYWFVKELAEAGHDVFCTFTKKDIHSYNGIRKDRIEKLPAICKQIYNCSFGSEKFFNLIDEKNDWDVLCHHAADVTNYKSPDFDVINALSKNTFNLEKVLTKLAQKNCRNIILTGSVFENDEGTGSDNLRAFSPYGLSKGLTFSVFKYYSQILNLKLGKFVIPNPFGPFEEQRFSYYLIKTWFDNKTASVNTPNYVRDNIHVKHLAKAYLYFVNKLESSIENFIKLNPSEYSESQGEFAKRFAGEMRKRLNLNCGLELKKQEEFKEPKVRTNTDRISGFIENLDENLAWKELSDYYKNLFLPGN